MYQRTHSRRLFALIAAAGASAAVLVAPGAVTARPIIEPPDQGPKTKEKPVDDPVKVCGGNGWRVIDEADILTPRIPGADSRSRWVAGTTFLLWNGSTGENCVTTIKRGKRANPGIEMTAQLQVQGQRGHGEAGHFTRYAGPIKAYGAGSCVSWSGSMQGVESVDDDPGKNGYEFCK